MRRILTFQNRFTLLIADFTCVPKIGSHTAASPALPRQQTRCVSDKKGFRPRRTSSHTVPIKKFKKKDWMKNNPQKFVDLSCSDPESSLGPLASGVFKDVQRDLQRKRGKHREDDFEEELRFADYMLTETGSTEDLVGERRALARETESETERAAFLEHVEDVLREGRKYTFDFDAQDNIKPMKKALSSTFFDEDDDFADENDDPDTRLDRNQLAHGEWSEMLVTVERTIKLWRGGRLQSYRALVIGGNANGCGGFGIGKAPDPIKAVDVAGRHCKRNIFFVDRYQNDGITRDLVGKQNSCIAQVRSTNRGLRGNELMREILKRFGIVNASCKAHGNKSPWNVVRATFKALMTHESLEEIALKRGKRLVSVDRAMRMQV